MAIRGPLILLEIMESDKKYAVDQLFRHADLLGGQLVTAGAECLLDARA